MLGSYKKLLSLSSESVLLKCIVSHVSDGVGSGNSSPGIGRPLYTDTLKTSEQRLNQTSWN